MDYPASFFNSAPATTLHIDLNSCFATIEQQANLLYRGRPLAVAAYASPRGCILAASVEAKKLGIKTGLRVQEGKLLCPDLIVLPPDPDKYRFVHQGLRRLLSSYSSEVIPKSIDEFVVDLKNHPSAAHTFSAAREIKSKIKTDIGDWLTVSIGLGPNRFLAKLASNLHKPDGLDQIDINNFKDIYRSLTLTDLPGINTRLSARLQAASIFTVPDFFNATIPQLKSVFRSINSLYWYLRLRGWEVDAINFGRRSFGHMYSLPQPLTSPSDLAPILHKLVQKLGYRLRRSGYQSSGLYLGLLYRNHTYWHLSRHLSQALFDSTDLYRYFYRLLSASPSQFPVANLAITCFDLSPLAALQLDLFGQVLKQSRLTSALDKINHRWGNFVITPAAMMNTGHFVADRIAFGQSSLEL